mgnify:FL=1
MTKKHFRLNQEHIIGLVCLAVSATILSITPSFHKGKANIGLTGPAFFPDLLAFIFILCGMYQLWYGTLKATAYSPITLESFKNLFKKKETRTAYLILLFIVGFILLFDTLGFLVTTFLFLVLFLLRLGVPRLQGLFYASFFTAVIYFLFGWLFTISLPSGILSYVGL